ncbi:MAG TPA: sigma-70 family RNA polymerase sigma factor [Candidatus Saccharimonadales bacterium]|nr:sigma-70 family RNA polymerase sigma factor [Candidatus Saccharimonadales bacterium]
MAEVRAGDRRAFEILVRRYSGRVFGLALRHVRSRDEAEEITQESLVRAWQGLRAFRGGEEFRAWLFRIAVNLARDRLRARRRHPPVPLEEVGEAELGAAPGAGPEEELESRQLTERLERALARLGEEHREILLLRALEEMSYQEMSAVLRVPAGTVMSRLARARMRLRELLEEGAP